MHDTFHDDYNGVAICKMSHEPLGSVHMEQPDQVSEDDSVRVL